MRRGHEPERALRTIVARLGDVQVQKVDPSFIVSLEPVHDGRHCAATQSVGVARTIPLCQSKIPEDPNGAGSTHGGPREDALPPGETCTKYFR